MHIVFLMTWTAVHPWQLADNVPGRLKSMLAASNAASPRMELGQVSGISLPSLITNVGFVVSLDRAVWLPPFQAGAGSLTGVR
jgi:hypothetical protein